MNICTLVTKDRITGENERASLRSGGSPKYHSYSKILFVGVQIYLRASEYRKVTKIELCK
jgi:hypothetical protein